jgi:outer membrane protein assembly factor BamB
MNLTRFSAVVVLATAIAADGRAENWPQFRGPAGMGQSNEKDLPIAWGGPKNEHVLWKTPLPHTLAQAKPDHNQSSPIIWDGKVFITTSFWPNGKTQKDYPEHHVSCYSAEGKQLWDATVKPGPWLLTDLRGGYTAPTPATDGASVFVLFGSGVAAAFDFAGAPLWRSELPDPQKFDVAIGTSPILYGDTLLILCDKTAKSSHLLSLDKKTGQVKWDVKRPMANFGHTTPVLAKINDRDVLLIGASSQLQAVDPTDGKVLWWANNTGDVPCPVVAGGLVYCDNGRGGVGIAVDPNGSGDVTKTHVKWKTDKKIGGLGSPAFFGDYLYRLRDTGLTVWKITTGEVLDDERVAGVPTTPSPFTTADGRIYFATAGRSAVVKAGPKIEVLATNDLGEDNGSSAAVSGGRIYFKGKNHLIAIGNK